VLKPVLSVAAVGFVGVLLYRLLWALMLPVVGAFVGFAMLLVKIALIAALVWGGFWLFRKLTERPSEA